MLLPSDIPPIPYWSTISDTGTLGDPTTASREKGEKLLTAAVEGRIEFVRIFRGRCMGVRVNHLT